MKEMISPLTCCCCPTPRMSSEWHKLVHTKSRSALKHAVAKLLFWICACDNVDVDILSMVEDMPRCTS